MLYSKAFDVAEKTLLIGLIILIAGAVTAAIIFSHNLILFGAITIAFILISYKKPFYGFLSIIVLAPFAPEIFFPAFNESISCIVLIVFSCSIGWIAERIREKTDGTEIQFGKLVFFYFYFTVIAFVFSFRKEIFMEQVIIFANISAGLFVFLMAADTVDSKQKIRKALIAVIISVFLVALFEIIGHNMAYSTINLSMILGFSEIIRNSMLFEYVNSLAFYLSAGAAAVISAMLFVERRKKIVLGIFLAIILLAMLYTYSRAAMMALLFSLVSLAGLKASTFFRNSKVKKAILVLGLIAMILLGVGVYAGFQGIVEKNFDTNERDYYVRGIDPLAGEKISFTGIIPAKMKNIALEKKYFFEKSQKYDSELKYVTDGKIVPEEWAFLSGDDTLTLDLGKKHKISKISVIYSSGRLSKVSMLKLDLSGDGKNFKRTAEKPGTGTSLLFEQFKGIEKEARFVRISVNVDGERKDPFAAIREVEVFSEQETETFDSTIFFNSFFQRIFKETTSSDFKRVEIWSLAAAMTEESPWVGNGIGSFSERFVELEKNQEIPKNAHNSFLQISAERGIPAAASLFLVVLIALAVSAILFTGSKEKIYRIVFAFSVSFLVIFLIHGMFEDLLFFEKPAVFFWSCLGISSASILLFRK